MKNPLSVAVLVLASSIFIFSSTCQSQTYQLTDLGSSVGTNSYAQGINNAGQVVGYWETTNGAHAFLYQAGVVTDLGLLGNLGSNNYALSINNSGQIVGFSLTTNGAVAFVCQQGTNTSLGTFGALGSYAFGINDHGQIVGHVDTGGGANAFLFDNGAVTSLGTLGGTNSFAYGVNNSLQVAGASLLADNFTTHAFLWQNSVISDLNQLLSDGSGWELVEAHGINDSGSIAGWGLTNGQQHAFIYYGSGWAQDLGTLAGGTNSYALGLNNSNQVVGGASYASATHAALWQSGTILDLNNLIAIPGWDLREATGINDLGQMVGWGITNGQVHAFLLLPKDFVSVVILSPVSNAVVRSGSSISLSASAASSQGSVIKVQFYQGKSALATITNAPFATLWNKPAAGKYVLTARATDSLGLVATSSVVTVTLDVPPTVTLTNPAKNSLIAPGTDVTLAASAASTNGAIAQVQFFQGTNLLGGVTNAPYSLTWSNVPAGPYQLRAVATDNDGLTTTSAVVSVLVDVAPSVTLTNPANGTLVRYGSNVSLGANVVAPDGTIIKVQFFRGASALATLTNAPYVATWSKPAAGSYALTARATDNFGLATTSSIVTVTVDIPPTVTLTNPANKAVIAPGTDVTLAASATSTNGTVAQVQFFQGTNLLGGVANAPFTLIWSNAPVGAYKLSAVATDNDGLTTTSAVVAVLVDASPTVTVTNPAIDAVVRYGSNISLGANVESAGGAITKVQFLQGTSTLATLTNAPYAATWTKPAVGNYVLSARATDNLGLISTSAPVPVFVVKTIGVPVVIGQPTNQTVIQGANVALNVVVSSTSLTPSYQWFFNANPLAGATNTSLAILNIQTNNAGIYSVAITNSLGGVTSSNALLTVQTPPSIATQPANQTTSLGGTAAFTVVATGTAPLSYQWYFNGTNQLAGATNSTLTVTNIQMTNAGNYSVTITNVVGEVTSANALLNVSGLPTITIQSTNQIVAQGSKVILGVTVSGPGPFNYQWLFNGTNLPPIITTVAGNGNAGYGGDNGAATLANLNNPSGVAVDA